MISILTAIATVSLVGAALYIILQIDTTEQCEVCKQLKPESQMTQTGGDVFVAEYTCAECLKQQEEDNEQ